VLENGQDTIHISTAPLKSEEQTEFAPSSLSSAPPARFTKRMIAALKKAYRLTLRRVSSSLSRRIVLLNMAGLIVMLLGFLWLIQTRESVIDARIQSLSTQAEIISAAIAASASVDTDGIKIDPEKLLSLQAGESGDISQDFGKNIEFSINPERVAPVLRRLVTPTRTRARIYDSDANLLLDTKDFYAKGDILRRTLPAPDDSATLFQRSWNSIKRKFGKTYLSPNDDAVNGKFTEVKTALAGSGTSLVRVNTEGQTTVFVAVPILKLKTVPGALLLSTQEGDIDDVIAAERFSIFMLFVIAASVMTLLSFLLAGTIAEPVRRLADAADRVRRGTKTRQEIPDFTDRSDEIGHLSGALREMTNSLYNRIEAIESFAADVAHELKNPLTSLRSAVETLPLAKSDSSKKRLLDVIHHDVQRLDRLISDISSASRLDADLQRNDMEPIQLDELLQDLVGAAQDLCIHNNQPISIIFEKPHNVQKKNQFIILGYASRLGQVISNLIDNAVSFSPINSIVRVSLSRIDSELEIIVQDEGLGIPVHALERVFERFYTDRPDHGFGQNSGLGLSISRQIIEAHKGRIWAENRYNQTQQMIGARFIMRLPVKMPVKKT
jgi:two-component system, OmpR family, sensor histidine kinase ChvG